MTSNVEEYFVVVCTGCRWEGESGGKKHPVCDGDRYGVDFYGNQSLIEFVELVKMKTCIVGNNISLHYEHPQMKYVIKMVDEKDFTRLKRVIRNVTEAIHVYVFWLEEGQKTRRRGEGSGSKRSSGKGSNNPEGNHISMTTYLPVSQNVSWFSTIKENYVQQPPIYHNVEPENFNYVGDDNVNTCDEPGGSLECTGGLLGKMLSDAGLDPLGDPKKDWYDSSDTENVDNVKECEAEVYSESYKKNNFFGMPNVPPCPGPSTTSRPAGPRASLSETVKVGQIFEDKDTLKTVLGRHAVYENKQFKVTRSSPDRYEAKCFSENCGWVLKAKGIRDTPCYQIRKFFSTHTCSSTQLNPNHRQAKKKVLATLVAEVLTQNPLSKLGGNDLMAFIQSKYQLKVSYPQVWRAKRFALELLRGTHEESFTKLPVYCYNLEKHNPGTMTFIKTDEEDMFQFVFVALGVSIRSFMRCCRKVIVVDGAHLKGAYTGMMLLAVAMDGNNSIVPLAFAICRSESNENWSYFMQYLYQCIGEVDDLAFVSDRNQGIATSIANQFPRAHHGICGHHLHGNVTVKFGKSSAIASMFWLACKAYTVREFERIANNLKAHHAGAWDYINEVDPKKWARALFPGRRYSHMTSNIAESVNALTREARRLPIMMLMDFYRGIVQQWYFQRRNLGAEMTTTLTTWADGKVEKRKAKCANWKVCGVSEEIFQVIGNSRSHNVNFRRRTCSCRKWQLSGIPCGHVITALRSQNHSDCSFYVLPYYLTTWYRATYEELVHPLPTQDEWDRPDGLMTVRVPIMQAPKPGRPKNKDRVPSQGEVPVKRKCKRCKQPGHNSGTCTAVIPTYDPPTSNGAASTSAPQTFNYYSQSFDYNLG